LVSTGGPLPAFRSGRRRCCRTALSESRLSGYLAGLPEVAARLGSLQALWQIRKTAVSELSTVFLVAGPAGDLRVKQARPAFEGPGGAESLREAQRQDMRRIFEDMLRFAGVASVRAVLGRHHVADFERIEGRTRRAACERSALLLARELIRDAHCVGDLAEVMAVAGQLRAGATRAGRRRRQAVDAGIYGRSACSRAAGVAKGFSRRRGSSPGSTAGRAR
jgi:hypothetical protein